MTTANRAAIRLATDGSTWERWDNFAQEWHALPAHWSKHEALGHVASLNGVAIKAVAVEPRAAS